MTTKQKREFPENLLPEDDGFPWLLATITLLIVTPTVFMWLVLAFGL